MERDNLHAAEDQGYQRTITVKCKRRIDMSGHSKWAQIKRKKAVADVRRGKLFTKLIKEITIAARGGGGDPEGNPRLRLAVNTAKAANMPLDNIQRAIQRGTGELPGVAYEEIIYEGYGPAGVALYMESVTDNRNRTVAELRHLLGKHGGRLGEAGSVAWMFSKKGTIRVSNSAISEDDILQVVIESGAEDMQPADEVYEITTSFENFERVKQALADKNIPVESAEVSMVPTSTIHVEGKEAEQLLKLVEVLDEHEDVQNVVANFEVDDAVFEKIVQQNT
jgi:YebC/PmpR family DNA-binding regulatory protein